MAATGYCEATLANWRGSCSYTIKWLVWLTETGRPMNYCQRHKTEAERKNWTVKIERTTRFA